MSRSGHTPGYQLSRRAAIRAGSLGLLGGLGMDRVLRAQEGTAATRAKNVIYIFLSGGLSQIDSFDMKPEAPAEIRGEFRPIPTKTPGLRVCEHLPELAKRSERWAICRSISHGSNEHSDGHYIMLTGRSSLPPGFDRSKPKDSDWPSIAALAGRMLPAKTPSLPPAMILPEKLIHRTGRTIPGQFGGLLGRQHDPFFLEASGFNPKAYGAYPEYDFHHADGPITDAEPPFDTLNLSLPDTLDFDRLNDRLQLRNLFDGQQRHLRLASESGGMDRYGQMAVDLLSDQTTQSAFDVHGVDARTQDRYGRNAFGWSLLMARQLIEAGVRLVQVNLGNNETWDTHQAVFPNLRNYLFPPMDRGVAALLDDLTDRGLLDETLVVMASEFGRTPKISQLSGAKLPGRDHWGAVQTVWLAGAGVTGGAVLGATDKLGGHPTADARRPEDFAATIYDALGFSSDTLWRDVKDRPMPMFLGKPLAELFG
ncbi:MAG: DUF1501 domain-containing protein [Verrucomicrobiae bacterium]|nr:DUF1501 domain-containing protein [Verrucomicrobiae bacterium]MCP5540895.1 DUF1501 domain-containing protein [Akkermansiaceae bacterium]